MTPLLSPTRASTSRVCECRWCWYLTTLPFLSRTAKVSIISLSLVCGVLYWLGAPIILDTSSPSSLTSARHVRPPHRPAANTLFNKIVEASAMSSTSSPSPTSLTSTRTSSLTTTSSTSTSSPSSSTFALFDVPDFHYTINDRVCDGLDDIFIITFVHSAPGNKGNRDAIRESWGSSTVLDDRGLRLRTVFLLAAVSAESVQQELEAESKQYGDIVQGSFVDAYRNLTYKHVMGMHWVSTFCPQAKYVLKTDDDIYVDVFHLTDILLDKYSSAPHLILCNQWIGMPVLRDVKSKWYVSEKEYADSSFSPYCSGWGYVFTPSVAKKVFLQSFSTKYFWVDDFLVSGPMLDAAKLPRTDFNSYFIFGVKELNEWLDDGLVSQSKYIIGPTWSDRRLMQRLWKKTISYEQQQRRQKTQD